MNLYEITKDMSALISALDEDTLNDTDFLQAVEMVEGAFTDKCEKICSLLKYYESLAEAAKAEKERLADLQKSREKKVDSLKKYLMAALEFTGYKKLETGKFNLTIRNNAESVKIEDETILSDEFWKVKETREPDKTKIKEIYKQTGNIPEGVRIERSQSLVIK